MKTKTLCVEIAGMTSIKMKIEFDLLYSSVKDHEEALERLRADRRVKIKELYDIDSQIVDLKKEINFLKKKADDVR